MMIHKKRCPLKLYEKIIEIRNKKGREKKKEKNIYLSYRIIDSFPRILKVKIIRLKPGLSAVRGQRKFQITE